VRSAECYLLGFGEVVGDVSVQLHGTNVLDRVHLLWYVFGAIQDIEGKVVFVFDRDELNTELPLGVGAGVDGIVQISSVEVWILSVKLQCFVPNERVCSQMWCPVELDIGSLAFLGNEYEGVYSKTLNVSVGARDCTVGQMPGNHVCRFWHQRNEVPAKKIGKRQRQAR